MRVSPHLIVVALAALAACSKDADPDFAGEGEAEAEAEAESEAEAEGEACLPGTWTDGLVQTGVGPQLNEIQDLGVAGNTLFACGNLSGLSAVDLTNPATPGAVTPLPLPSPAPNTCNFLSAAAPIVWVSNHQDNIHPSFIARVEPGGTNLYVAGGSRNFEGLVQAGGFVYVAAHTDGVVVFDALTLAEVDQITTGIVNAWSVAYDAGVVWVGDQDALRAFDSSGTALGSVPVPALVLDIAVSGTTAWLALGSAGLAAVDISNSAAPLLLAVRDTPGSAQAVAVDGVSVTVADWDGVRLYDGTDPTAPVLAGAQTDVGDRVLAVAAAGGHTYAGEWRRPYAFSADSSARGPEALIEPAADIDIGRLDPGVAGEVRVALRNDGAECLEVTAITAEAGAPIEIQATAPPFWIEPGGFEFVTLEVTPASMSPAEGTVTFATNDPDEPSLDVRLQWNQPGVSVGDPAVDFALPDEGGTIWSLAGCAGSCVLLAYFATA